MIVTTQIELTPEVFAEVERLAQEQAISPEELMRRAVEELTNSHRPAPQAASARNRELPKLNLGLQFDPFSDPDWRVKLALGDSNLSPGDSK